MNQSAPARSPLLSTSYALGAGYATQYLYQLSQLGIELAAPAAIAAGGLAAYQTIRALDDWGSLRSRKRKYRRVKDSAKQHGKARFANLKDLKRENLVGGKRGIFLGQFKGRDIWYDGECSGHLYAPSGAGKTTSSFIPTLLAALAIAKKDRALATSFLINDPASEIYAVCHQALRKAGYDVAVLSSWAGEITNVIGEEVVDAKLNMFSGFDPNADPAIVRDESKLRVKMLIPSEKPNTEEKTKFFNRGGRSLIECISLREYAQGRKPNLVTIHQQLMASPHELSDMFVDCMETSAFGGYLSNLASSLHGIMTGASEQFAGYLGVAMQALEPYDAISAVGKHVSGTGFDVRRFKGDKPVAVFVMYPGKRSVTHQRMLNAEWSYLLEMICADPRRRRITALIDETASLQYVPSLMRFLNEGRKHQLRMVCAWQDLTGQAEMIYGKAGMKQILAAGHFLWASGVREPETCDLLSKITGTQSVEDVSLNDRTQSVKERIDQNYSLSNKGVPMMRDVRTELQSNEVLISYRNLPMIKATKVPYYTRRCWASIAGKNPFAG